MSGECHKLVLEGLFGPVKQFVTTEELIKRKQLAELNIKCLVLNYPTDLCKKVSKYNYQEEIDFIISNDARNEFLKNLVLSLKGNTLILYQRVEDHGKKIHELIQKQCGSRKTYFIHGGVDAEERERVRKEIENQNDGIITASYGTFSTGINIKNLHNLILASPTKSRIRNLQSIGRGLRIGDSTDILLDNMKVTVYDLVDNLQYKKKANFTLKHFMERVKIYNSEKFPYKTYNIEMKE